MATPTFLKINFFTNIKSESRRSSGGAREKCGSTHVFFLGFSFSCLGSTHLFTLFSLTRYFGICSLIIFLHYTPITGSVPHSLFDPWFDFQLDAHIFITERWKTHFHIHTFFERFALITLSFSLLWSSSWRLNQGYFGIDWVSISCWCRSSHPIYFLHISIIFWIIDRNFLVIFVVISY